ncbi:MAG: MOSC domain-containing protein [Pseudomonadota bacterium]
MQQMRIHSVNTAAPAWLEHGGRRYRSGIGKRPVEGAVQIGFVQSGFVHSKGSGVAGDAVCNEKYHGGPDQAVYAYSQDDYDWWADETGRAFPPGSFGENLTIEGMPTDLAVGDRLLTGVLVLEVTAPRIPCATLEAALRTQGFAQQFREAERPGAYLRVLNAGAVRRGDSATLLSGAENAPGIVELFRFNYAPANDAERIRRYLDAPLAARLRGKLEARLKKLGTTANTA